MASDDRVSFRHVKTEVTLDTPMGPKVFWYAPYSGSDRIEGQYRTQDVSGTDLPGLRKDIERIEAEYQAKKVREDKRRMVAKSPEQAVLYLPAQRVPVRVKDPAARRGYRTEYRSVPARFEEVQVRGIDMRSDKALVTRANGDREQHDWGGLDAWGRRRVSGTYLLRPLNEGERADLMSLQRVLDQAEAHLRTVAPRNLGDVIGDGPEMEVWVHLDVATGERWAEVEGTTYRGESSRAVKSRVHVRLAEQAGYPYALDDGSPVRLWVLCERQEWLGTATSVFASEADVLAYLEAERVVEEAQEALYEVMDEAAFDRSLVMVPEDEPKPQEAAESPESVEPKVPGVQAPSQQDWDE